MPSPYLQPLPERGSDSTGWDRAPKMIPVGNKWLGVTYYYADVYVVLIGMVDDVPTLLDSIVVWGDDISAGADIDYDPVNQRFVVVYGRYNGSSIHYVDVVVGKIDGDTLSIGTRFSVDGVGVSPLSTKIEYSPGTGCFLLAYQLQVNSSDVRTYIRPVTVTPGTLTSIVGPSYYIGSCDVRYDRLFMSYDPLTSRVLLITGNTISSDPADLCGQVQSVYVAPGLIVPSVGTKALIDSVTIPSTWYFTGHDLVYDPASNCHLLRFTTRDVPLTNTETYGWTLVLKLSGTTVTQGTPKQEPLLSEAKISTDYDIEPVNITNRLHVCYNPSGSHTHMYNTGYIDNGSMEFFMLYENVLVLEHLTRDYGVRSSWNPILETLLAYNMLSSVYDGTLVPYGEYQDGFWTRKTGQVEVGG